MKELHYITATFVIAYLGEDTPLKTIDLYKGCFENIAELLMFIQENLDAGNKIIVLEKDTHTVMTYKTFEDIFEENDFRPITLCNLDNDINW